MGKIEDLKDERRMLLKRVSVIDDVIAEYEAWEKRVALLLPASHREASTVSPHPVMPRTSPVKTEGTSVSPRVPEGSPTPMDEFILAVDAVLRETDRPLVRTPLLEALEARGVVVGGSDPRNTLSARLNRLPHVTNFAGKGFWLADRPYPPSGYDPDPKPSFSDESQPADHVETMG